MPADLDDAKTALRNFVEYSEEDENLSEAAFTVIQARDEEGLGLLFQVLEIVPDAAYLEKLWEIAEDPAAEDAQRAAVQCLSAILTNAKLSLEQPDEYDVILSAEDLEKQATRSMALFGQESLSDEMRLMTLETAGAISSAPAVVKAAEAAYAHADPNWIAAGLFALRNALPDRARELVYKSVEHENFIVRSEAITGLADLGEEEDLKRLTDFVYDGSAYETSAALWALVEVPKKEASDLLAEATKWLDGKVKEEARAANLEWSERWSEYLAEDEEEGWEGDVRESSGKLDKYLSDDFDLDGEDWGDDGGD